MCDLLRIWPNPPGILQWLPSVSNAEFYSTWTHSRPPLEPIPPPSFIQLLAPSLNPSNLNIIQKHLRRPRILQHCHSSPLIRILLINCLTITILLDIMPNNMFRERGNTAEVLRISTTPFERTEFGTIFSRRGESKTPKFTYASWNFFVPPVTLSG